MVGWNVAMHKQSLATVASWLAESQSAVALTGAGISTESGIPDFRSPGGVWSKYRTVYYDEFLASDSARQEYWRQKSEAQRDFVQAQPNVGHQVLAHWEEETTIVGVITQNIDGLHQLAGSRRVLELHGSARQARCTNEIDCLAQYPIDPLVDQFLATGQVPECPECGAPLKHATISFGQMLPPDVLAEATRWSREADLMLAIGSSLVVTPAANLPAFAKERGSRLVIINRDETPLDTLADLVIRNPIGQVLEAIDAARCE